MAAPHPSALDTSTCVQTRGPRGHPHFGSSHCGRLAEGGGQARVDRCKLLIPRADGRHFHSLPAMHRFPCLRVMAKLSELQRASRRASASVRCNVTTLSVRVTLPCLRGLGAAPWTSNRSRFCLDSIGPEMTGVMLLDAKDASHC